MNTIIISIDLKNEESITTNEATASQIRQKFYHALRFFFLHILMLSIVIYFLIIKRPEISALLFLVYSVPPMICLYYYFILHTIIAMGNYFNKIVNNNLLKIFFSNFQQNQI